MGDPSIEELQRLAVEKLRDAIYVITGRDRQIVMLEDAVDAIADYVAARMHL